MAPHQENVRFFSWLSNSYHFARSLNCQKRPNSWSHQGALEPVTLSTENQKLSSFFSHLYLRTNIALAVYFPPPPEQREATIIHLSITTAFYGKTYIYPAAGLNSKLHVGPFLMGHITKHIAADCGVTRTTTLEVKTEKEIWQTRILRRIQACCSFDFMWPGTSFSSLLTVSAQVSLPKSSSNECSRAKIPRLACVMKIYRFCCFMKSPTSLPVKFGLTCFPPHNVK